MFKSSDKMVELKIDGITLKVSSDSTVMEAARSAGIEIPSMCYLRLIYHHKNDKNNCH